MIFSLMVMLLGKIAIFLTEKCHSNPGITVATPLDNIQSWEDFFILHTCFCSFLCLPFFLKGYIAGIVRKIN